MRQFFKLSVSACILLSALSYSASAQQVDEADQAAPRTLSPRSLSKEMISAPDITPVEVKSLSGGINVRTLGSVDKEALGVLSGSQAFATNMWEGSERAYIEKLIQRLPVSPSAPYLRILQRRLLLSTAQPPQGKSGDVSLLSLRAQKLAQMGQANDVVSLIETAPQDERDPALLILETEALLLDNDMSKACTNAAVQSQSDSAAFWIKTLAFCRMLAKQNDQAMLPLSLLRESGDEDPTFYRLMDALNVGERAKIDSLPAPSALELALIQASKAVLSDDARASEDPRVLNFLTRAGDINAMQKAVELNLASADFLSESFKRFEFSKEQLADPLNAAEKLDPLKAQALLYQVGTKEGQLPVISSETMAQAFELAEANASFFAIARVYRNPLAKFVQSIDMLWFAPTAMRALLASGDWENAKSWYLMLRNAAFTDAEAAKTWAQVRPLAALAGFDTSPEAVAQALNNWWAAQPESPQSFDSGALLFSIADGLGLNVPQNLWLQLMDGPRQTAKTSAKAGVWIAMNHAAQEQKLGETVTLALLGLGSDKTATLDSMFLRDALLALRNVGLERDARAVAVETILQAGY